MSISKEQYRRESEALQSFLNEIPELMERESGFVRRNSKLGGKELVQILSLGSLENGKASLEDFARIAGDLGLEISASALHQRLTMEAVGLLAQVCRLWIQQRPSEPLRQVLKGFGAVRIFDSSQIQLPPSLIENFRGSRNASMLKVQLAYEYRSGRIEALELQAGDSPDQNCLLPQSLTEAGDLALFDLGFFDQKRFAILDAQGAFFLSRLQSQVALYTEADTQEQIALLEQLEQLPQSVLMGEQKVYLGQKAKVPVRLIYYRLSPDLVAERHRKAKENAKKRGKSLSQRNLDWLNWAFFISNAPADLLQLELIALVYSIRWQIELLFKLWKQEMDWDFMSNWRLERVLAQFWGRSLALMLFHRLTEKYQEDCDWELSWTKSLRLLKKSSAKLIAIVGANFRGILRFLAAIDRDFRRFGRKLKRRKDPSSYSLLQLFGA